MRRRRVAVLLALVVLVFRPPARAERVPQPLLVLISFDGWRWDYAQRYGARNMQALARRGVRAARLIPSFPVLTFPNHYTIVTGRYPAHHGIVANNMIDQTIGERFTMSSATAKDAVWWGGEPVWVTAIRRGLRAATMFWPGEEAAIGGVRPTFWQPFDKAFRTADRVQRVLGFLALPENERPSFVSLYFDEVDTAGHDFGIDSPELRTAVANLDSALGAVVAGVERLGVSSRTTIVAVSDHGMTPLSTDRIVYLDDYVDPATVDVTEWHGMLAVAPNDGDVDALYRRLHNAHPALAVYRRADVPLRLHYRDNPRIAPVIGLPRRGWAITTRERLAKKPLDKGAHGFEPQFQDVQGLFVAGGPGIPSGVTLPPFENVEIYNVLCAVLGITPAPNDGSTVLLRRLGFR